MRLASVALAGLAAWLAACSGSAPPATPVAAPSGDGFHLVDVAAEAGLDIVQEGGGDTVDFIIDSLGAGAAWLDYDGDGDPDLYLAQGASRERPVGPPDVLLRNEGDADGDGVPSFRDVTVAAGLGDTRWSVAPAVADYDNDGDPDLYLANWGPDRLYRNNGDGTFTDVAAAAGLADSRCSAGAAWGDVDRDGDLDLYVTNYVAFDFERYPRRGEKPANGAVCVWKGLEVFCGPRNLEAEADAFYRNEGDPDGDGVPKFVDATAEAGLRSEADLYGLGALFFDANADGAPDLYVANDSVRNLFFVNRGDGTFEEQAILAGLAYDEQGIEQASMGISSGDYDGDGRLDLVVTNFSHDHDTLYHNEGGAFFADVSFTAGVGTPTFFPLAWGVAFADLDQDGSEDLFVANGHVYPQVDDAALGTSYRQRNLVLANRKGSFVDVTDEAGPGLAIVKSSRALVPVDLEGDGDLDVLITNRDDTPDLLRNDGATGHWLAVRLRGTRSNRDGIGARVTLVSTGRPAIREIRTTTSWAGSMLPVAHFGLGPDTGPLRLEVRWPSGTVQRLDDVEADRLLVLDEPAGSAAGGSAERSR